jgi:nitrate reductase NapA
MDRLSRREFLRRMLILVPAGTGLISLNPFELFAGDPERDLIWDKAPCRFCGTGCSVLVGVRDGKIIAVKGDPESPVNRGTLCIKGYALPFIMYGKDRLTKPLVRKRRGKYHPDGILTESTWDEAFDLIVSKAKDTLDKKGPSALAMYGSGQWTIWEGYAIVKIWKGGLRSNTIDVNARLCMASAVAGFMTTFGMDEPPGNYDDIDHADVFISWGSNIAEQHPVLYSRIIDRLLKNRDAKLINLTTVSNETSRYAEKEIIFKPQTDLAIANCIANLIIQKGYVNEDFVNNYVIFKRGKFNIGYGLKDNFKFRDEAEVVDFDTYKNFVAEYTPEYVERLSGVSRGDLDYLAELYGNPRYKVMSFWTMGVNQHTRGTWMNNLIYNLHLLTGKICEPGNSPFSLTGQPSACGTCREVGTFTHRLPADMVVTNPEHRRKAERIWRLPEGTIPAKPTYHAVEMMRALDRGDILFMWINTTNPFQSVPNLNRYRSGALKRGRFIVVSDVYPTRSTEVADVVLPSAMWVEKEGAFGNSERRTHFFRKMVDAPGEAKSDLWQFLMFAKKMGLSYLFKYPGSKYPLPKDYPPSDASLLMGFHIEKALWDEYRMFGIGEGHDLAEFEVYHRTRGLRWPVVNGRETKIRYREGYDPYVPKGRKYYFYGNKKYGGRAVIWLRAYEEPPEKPDKDYPFWLCTGRVLEHWHTGTMTRRVDELFKAYPYATCSINPEDASELGIRTGDRIRLVSRRGSIEVYVEVGGRFTPQKGVVFVPFFDEDVMINELTLDAYCPISKQPDFKKCAVRIEKL